jgi:lipoyl(octanoyl) transferase
MVQRSEIAGKLARDWPIRWETEPTPIPYEQALARMDLEVSAITAGLTTELVWLLQHPPLYTAGTSAKSTDLVDPDRFPVFQTGRGGQYTYHGPGQRVAYVMLNLKGRGGDVRAFVARLEDWLINVLAAFGIAGDRREDRVGVWVSTSEGEKKIAALGIRVRGGITLHGVSININPDLSHFNGIVPCGISDYGVTSFADLGVKATMTEVDDVMRWEFTRLFSS